jgi:hypothetical protein
MEARASRGAALAPAADAAVPQSGVWRGDNTQILDAFTPPGGEPFTYKTRLVISEFQQRITGVAGWVRMECPATLASGTRA